MFYWFLITPLLWNLKIYFISTIDVYLEQNKEFIWEILLNSTWKLLSAGSFFIALLQVFFQQTQFMLAFVDGKMPRGYLRTFQKSVMELFVEIVNYYIPLSIFGKSFIIDAWQGLMYMYNLLPLGIILIS